MADKNGELRMENSELKKKKVVKKNVKPVAKTVGKVSTTPKAATVKKTAVAKKKEVVEATVVKPEVKKATKRASGITIDVFDKSGKKATTMELPQNIFGAKINDALMSQAVRVYLANQRAGSASTKTRGQVKGSTRKIYRQKGTGKARHGSNRAPIFVHGGIAHGPHPKDYSLSMSKKMRQKALFSALSSKLKDAQVWVISGISDMNPKTKTMVGILNTMAVHKKNTGIMLVLPGKTDNVERAARNIKGIGMINATQLNTYEVLKANALIFLQDAVGVMEKHFLKA